MRRQALVVLSCVVASSSGTLLRAQDAPTFRTGTTVIEFTIVALDGNGNPVTDLTKDDITLTEGTRTRDIAFFRFDGSAPAVSAAARPAVPAGFVTNRLEPERNAIAIVVDYLNSGAAEKYGQTAMRGLLLHYLDSLPPNTRAGLFRYAEFQPMETLQTFTDDIELLRAQVKALKPALRLEHGSPSWHGAGHTGTADARQAMLQAEGQALYGINSGIAATRVSMSLSSLDALGGHMAGIPGRKSVVWITNGPPIQLKYGHDSLIFEPRIRAAAQRLANQGIAVYPIHAVGLTADRRKESDDEVSTLSIFADVTGGRLVKNSNDLPAGIKVAANDQRASYTLGFYAEDVADDEWRRLKIEVKRPGVTLRHREGYLAVRRAQPQNWPAKSWNDLAYEPLDATGIRMNARSEAAAREVTVTLQISAADLYFHDKAGRMVADVEIGLVEKKATKKAPEATNVRIQPMEISLADAVSDTRLEVVPVKTTWALNPGTSSVRVIVRDRFTGRFGTLETPLNRR